ncbi:MAG: hypothetical protein IPK82_11065 [Polyangiaceae bacterium]|nr:hypothetical protein [Polyangiaceae bacterium]
MADVSADLESTLDRIVQRLGKPGAPRDARALLVDARRLQQVVRHWRTVAPTDAARLEMEERVATLQQGAERVLGPDVEVTAQPSPLPEKLRPSSSPTNARPPTAERARVSPAPIDPSPPPARPRPASEPLRTPSALRVERPKAVVEEVKPGAITDPFVRRSAARARDRVSTPPSLDPELEAPRQAPQRSIASPTPQRSAATPTPPVQRSVAMPTPVAKSPSVAPALFSDAVVRESPPELDEHTRAAPLDVEAQVNLERAAARPNGPLGGPVRPRTLPDLDISGIAELVEEPLGSPLRDPLDLGARNRTNRPAYEARRVPSEPPPRGRPLSEPPPRARPSPTPANGRRRAEQVAEERATVEAGARPSRYSELFDDPETHDGVIYPSADDGARGSHPPHRPTPRPAAPSPPPPALRGEKTAIAVRPLPAPEKLDPRLIMLTEPYSPRAEAFRALRRKLSGPGAPRTIAVTSAEPEEGKSTCAANLALSFRETSNEKVLLVEANLRSPGLAKLFAFEPPQCFAKQMAKNRDMDRASWTVAEQFEPLHVLAVAPSSRTSPMIDPVAFANALEQLVDAGYDHIIIDTPHALGGSDVNLVADIVDGVVVVAWIKKSKRSLIKKAVEQLKPATILGVVTLDG